MQRPTFLVTAVLLSALLAPVLFESNGFTDVEWLDAPHEVNDASNATSTVSPSQGWTTGGEEITITGTGFLDMAFKNVTSDGEAYTWTTDTINYVDGSGVAPTVAVDSNGTVHIVHVNYKENKLWHQYSNGG